MDIGELKLIMKKAKFAGNAFINHLETFSEYIEGYEDGDLAEITAQDPELEQLVNDLEAIGEKLSLV